MIESFDPYHKLLGIPKRDQPPTFYRLLGLESFEADRDVIDAAANKQMGYLQNCCNGEHAESAERLLNEVSEARLRLLNPQKKSEYDEQLRFAQSQRQVVSDSVVPQQTSVATTPAPKRQNPVVLVDRPEKQQRRRARKTQAGGLSWLLGTIVSTTVIGVVWMMVVRRADPPNRSGTELAATQSAEAPPLPDDSALAMDTSREESAAWSTIAQAESGRSQPLPSRSLSRSADLPQSVEPVSTPMAGGSVPQSDSQQPKREFSPEERERLEGFRTMATPSEAPEAVPEQSPLIEEGETDRVQTDSRLPVPEGEPLNEAVAEIERLFSDRFQAAQTPYEKQLLGKTILDLAQETDSPTKRYAMQRTALETSVEAGDFRGAMSAIDQMQNDFAISAIEQRLEVMQRLEPVLFRPLDRVAMADKAEELIDAAIMRDDYQSAGDLCVICKKISRDLRNSESSKKFAQWMDEIETLESQHPTAVLARQRIASEPDNAKANEFLGRFLFFGKTQWHEGLQYLSRGDDPVLRELATAELQPPPNATEMAGVADRWWEIAETRGAQQMVKRTSRQRAVDLYRRAIAHGLSGLAKVAAESRIESAAEVTLRRTPNAEQGEPKRPRGVPPAAKYFNGNWYLFSEERVQQSKAVKIALQAGGRPVVVRSQAEHDFLVAHGELPLMLGLIKRDGVWYDALNQRQDFFLWDTRNRQPSTYQREVFAAIAPDTSLWHDYPPTRFYFVIEWGRE
ncbi:C-type lectin domain-containing protein [Allorhodopirellula solitaria]|uniref:J domain-containing protein n=1 Tax=Allorhodopirellula solitaria TaxID=2527987 RepID=A0A5C5YEH7_9BACT|nr:C-type lectin domain-containing protein [Allorhodopirellula solitaria]TWT74156.1 hypothetical protein CA85_10430 [Allorhodopirellula solitaria]